VFGAIGALGNTVAKALATIDRITDAGYSHADTYAANTEIRNAGSVKDVLLDEEERDLEREIRRIKFMRNLEQFKAQDTIKPSKAKPATERKAASAKS
jgi:hypothetical protein